MAQEQVQISPKFLNCDTAYEDLKPTESPFVKDLTWDINGNPNQGIGTNNPTGEGQNMFSLTPVRSNKLLYEAFPKPAGFNLNIGYFESITTREGYYFNYNDKGNHGIYVIYGDTMTAQQVIVDPELNFTDDPKAFIANHRVTLRAIYDKDNNIVEKYLILTDGNSWQKWINVVAAIKTNGFDTSLFPYWTLQPPHFDRRELLEYATRPPMYKPTFKTLPNTQEDAGKINNVVDKVFQICFGFINTDGRTTTVSPYSLPLISNSTEYLSNPENQPKKYELTFYAGSPLTEKIVPYVREATVEDGGGSNIAPEWGDWYSLPAINKYTDCGANSPEIIGTDYWLRTNQWADYDYDPVFNTIKYIFDNSKLGQIVDQDTINRLFNDMPIRSKSQSDLGSAIIECDNEYGYDNFSCSVMDNLDVIVKERPSVNCNSLLREVSVYAIIAKASDEFNWLSQPSYYLGTDTQMRFGGVKVTGADNHIEIFPAESKYFELDYADKKSLRCYAKGTPYYADGILCQVNSDNSIVELTTAFDGDNEDTLVGWQGVYASGGYFMIKFKFQLPAGRYDLALGRHNVASSGDYRNTSTYVAGIANSRVKSGNGNGFIFIQPNAIVSYSKEMQIDCTEGNVDVWGNNSDLFYVCCPWVTTAGNGKYRWIEGYLKESQTSLLPVEMFPYIMNHSAIDIGGNYTDKNGFYFARTKVANSDEVDIQFFCKLNCSNTNFIIPTSHSGIGWKVNATAYLSDHNNGVVGDCNRILLNGKITSLDGVTGYSNVAISIADGSTVYSNRDGTFQLVVHNGQETGNRLSNIFINAGGNFQITIADCGYVPLSIFNEALAPCFNCTERIIPNPLNVSVNIISLKETSLKEGGTYSVGVYGADLAGRLMYVNVIKDVYVPSFLERNNTLATYFQLQIAAALNLKDNYPDIKWITTTASKNLSIKRYVDWVGDKVTFIDNNGNIVSDPSSAVFCSIYIQSLYNFNVQNRFSVLAKYQFVKGDRLRIYDDGEGNLYDVATYGDPIETEILGTNYNQAAINAGLVPPVTNTVFNTTASQTTQDTSVTLFVRYDSRFNKVDGKTGFWIEMLTPTQVSDVFPFNETAGFYPVINGEIADYIGYDVNGKPAYDYPVELDIEYWDTYLIQRNITVPESGDKFFGHPFNSPNVTDSFGGNIASGGRQWIKNDNAMQMWYKADVIKSDNFVKDGLINGLATFRTENRKDYSNYPWGAILAVHAERSIILFICENDYFTTDYNFHYTYANAQGVMVTNLDNGLSTPHQKIGDNYGLSEEHTRTVIVDDKAVYWFDAKNTAFVKCNYQTAVDVSQLNDGEMGGIQAYLNTKTQVINEWNNTHDRNEQFDVVCGIDAELGKIYVTFRPRRKNTNDLYSYVNQKRNIELLWQETFVYDIQRHGWVMFVGFTPEGYGRLRGKKANVEMFTFAAGKPYYHNNTPNDSFLKFYGIQCEPVLIWVGNDKTEDVKILQSIAHDSNNNAWYIDEIYTNEKNSYSYLSLNQFKKKEGQWYAAVLRNMNSYPPPYKDQLFRSMLFDGKRNFGRYWVVRMVGDPATLNRYTQLSNVYYKYILSANNTK